MALQWLSCRAAVLFLLLGLGLVGAQHCGNPGIPGIPGSPGTNGADGLKGEKGDAGEGFASVSSQKGRPGSWGPPGRPGLKGGPGFKGSLGDSGLKGEKGSPFNPSSRQAAFFSYKRESTEAVELESALDFNSEIRPELEPQFKGESLRNGNFTCVKSGVYFFSYHISAKSRVCLKLMKGSDVQLAQCDTSQGFLVTSGSAVLDLQAGDTVSLQVSRFNTIVSQSSTSHTFTGFLIFPTA